MDMRNTHGDYKCLFSSIQSLFLERRRRVYIPDTFFISARESANSPLAAYSLVSQLA